MKDKEMSQAQSTEGPIFITPEELASRWHCARTSVDRIIRREKLSRICLGTGKNGMVRFLYKEILEYEAARTVRA